MLFYHITHFPSYSVVEEFRVTCTSYKDVTCMSISVTIKMFFSCFHFQPMQSQVRPGSLCLAPFADGHTNDYYRARVNYVKESKGVPSEVEVLNFSIHLKK